VFGIAILGLVVLAVRSSPAWTWFGLVLGLPATVLLLAQAVTGDNALLPYSDRERSWIELLFLSFTTLSSTGLSDVVPVQPFARSVVMIEQLAGVGYVAMVVSRLAGLMIVRRANID
jgi:Ion channel